MLKRKAAEQGNMPKVVRKVKMIDEETAQTWNS